MSLTARSMSLNDGRTLGYAEYGDSAGVPVFYFHGFPASRLEGRLPADAAAEKGVRLIAPDRPGFGLSDFASERTILDWPADVEQLADYLGLENFAILGVSGGGPYALACALRLAGRISATALVAPLGPVAEGAGRAEMNLFARMSFSLARNHPSLYTILYGKVLIPLLRRRPTTILSLLQPSAADKPVVERPEVCAQMEVSILEAFRRGGRGALHELGLYARPWGFALHDVTAPVHLWQGDQDGTVPLSMGKYIAEKLPDCRARFLSGEGHFSLAIDHACDFFQVLRDSFRACKESRQR